MCTEKEDPGGLAGGLYPQPLPLPPCFCCQKNDSVSDQLMDNQCKDPFYKSALIQLLAISLAYTYAKVHVVQMQQVYWTSAGRALFLIQYSLPDHGYLLCMSQWDCNGSQCETHQQSGSTCPGNELDNLWHTRKQWHLSHCSLPSGSNLAI